MFDIDINWHKVESQASEALATWGYSCECKVETRLVMAIKVYSRNGVELDGKYRIFRFCANEALTLSSSGRHRANYYEWQEGLRKFSSANFWLRRGGDIRGALSDAELAYHRKYDSDHREERLARSSAYAASHREEIASYHAAYDAEYYAANRDDILAHAASYRESHSKEISVYKAAYRASHREEIAAYDASRRDIRLARNAQLWSNGSETLKWSTLKHRGRKSDLLAQGWHLVE